MVGHRQAIGDGQVSPIPNSKMISSQILLPLGKEHIFTNRQVKPKKPKRMKYGFSLVIITVRLSSIKYPLSCDSICLINTNDYQTSMKASGVMELWTK